MGGDRVQLVELLARVDALLAAEDPDPQIARCLELRVIADWADRDRQPAVGAQLAFLAIAVKASIRSIGSGKTIVVFWLTPISRSVCR